MILAILLVRTPRLSKIRLPLHSQTDCEFCLRTFARKFSSQQIFLKFLLRSDNELLVSEIQKKVGVTDFVLEKKPVEKYPVLDKLTLVIYVWFTRFVV